MFKTLLEDRKIIEGKYHKNDESYTQLGNTRWENKGYDYDSATGMADAEIVKNIAELDARLEAENTPHPIHKALLFEYVLDNTQIEVAPHDYFVGFYSNGRLLAPTRDRWSSNVYNSFPDEKQIISDHDKSGTTYGWLDFDHTVPDWDSLLELGFKGILERAEKAYAAIESPSEKQTALFEGIKIEYNAILHLLDRFYNYALTKSFEKAPKIAACIKNLHNGAPQDSYDVLQMIYLYFMLSEHVDNYQVRSLGYGIDSSLYPYFKADIESGRYTKEEIGELIGYFLMQFQAIDNYWGQPVYLAGTNLDGSTKVNELSYLVLDVYDKLGLYNPKVQVKVSKSTPNDFIMKILEMVRHGVSSFVFINEDMIVKCLMAGGATYAEAVDSVISGCYEYKVKAKGIGISCAYFNPLKYVSYVLDNGYDTVTGKQIGIETGDISKLDTFEKFYKAYLKQFAYGIDTYLTAMYALETRVQEINPSLMFSATMPDCVETMTDALDGGLTNVTGTLLCGVGTATDALMAVYELVYDKKVVTLAELKAALDANWVGYEKLRAQALNLTHKFGNGDKMADSYAAAITRFVHDCMASRRNGHGDRYGLEMHSARAFLIQGEKTKATPDGRKAGEEISKNASPTPGSDRNGITALIKSVTSIDTSLCNVGFCLDAMLHPSAIQGEDGLIAFKAVLDTYMAKGGQSIHFNVFNPEMLRDAQKHPEKYKNLQVRVCGWNVLWNKMDKKEQDAYILRAENIQ